jgi:hypothetical protein
MQETMPTKKRPFQRSPKVKLVTLSIDRHSLELLRELSPTTKSLGLTIGALVQAEYARRLERQAARGQAGAAARAVEA